MTSDPPWPTVPSLNCGVPPLVVASLRQDLEPAKVNAPPPFLATLPVRLTTESYDIRARKIASRRKKTTKHPRKLGFLEFSLSNRKRLRKISM